MSADNVAACYATECPTPGWCQRGVLAKTRRPQFGDFTEGKEIELDDGMGSTTCAHFLNLQEDGGEQ